MECPILLPAGHPDFCSIHPRTIEELSWSSRTLSFSTRTPGRITSYSARKNRGWWKQRKRNSLCGPSLSLSLSLSFWHVLCDMGFLDLVRKYTILLCQLLLTSLLSGSYWRLLSKCAHSLKGPRTKGLDSLLTQLLKPTPSLSCACSSFLLFHLCSLCSFPPPPISRLHSPLLTSSSTEGAYSSLVTFYSWFWEMRHSSSCTKPAPGWCLSRVSTTFVRRHMPPRSWHQNSAHTILPCAREGRQSAPSRKACTSRAAAFGPNLASLWALYFETISCWTLQ